ncbi:MAG TPA: glycosyltransferase [Thermoanaerobaculia bacterium]|nr:glycosyltransferase [Thermoanaerobaculia bacterium]
MTRVALVCPEPLGHRHPAGVGIRFLELARLLRSSGLEVELLSPDGGSVEGCRAARITPATLREATGRADSVLVQGHAINDLLAHGVERPLVVDLYDPYVIENFHYLEGHGEKVFLHDHATLMASLRAGDCFLCASEAQRMFHAGLLLSVGRINPLLYASDPTARSLLRTVPFGVQPPRRRTSDGLESREIFFGAIYDWYEPRIAIEAIAIARRRDPRLTLTFTHHPNAETTPQSLFGRTRALVDAKGLGAAVRFVPWVAYEDRGSFYDRFALALLTFRPSLETDLAMRTRMFDCFWGGLPVITSSAGGSDPVIAEYRSGTVVAGQEPERYADALLAMLDSPERYREAVKGCARFVADHQWERLARPLVEFCRAPRRDPTREAFATPPPIGGRSEPLLRRLGRRLRGHG